MHLGVRMDERRRSQTRGTNRNQGEPSLVTEHPPDRTAGCRRFPTRRDCSAACASALSSRWFCCSLSPPPCPIFLLRNVLVDRLDEEITVALGREAEEFEILADGIAYGRAPSATTSPQSSTSTSIARSPMRARHCWPSSTNGSTTRNTRRQRCRPTGWTMPSQTGCRCARAKRMLDTEAGTARFVAVPFTAGDLEANVAPTSDLATEPIAAVQGWSGARWLINARGEIIAASPQALAVGSVGGC